MKFIKKEDIDNMLENIGDFEDIQECVNNLKTYNAEYKPYMPIRLRDYGYKPNGKPDEFDCGADQNHHWLRITETGDLRFDHMQNGSGSMSEEDAKTWNGCCFIPTYGYEDEFGRSERYITPSRLLVIEEEENENEE